MVMQAQEQRHYSIEEYLHDRSAALDSLDADLHLSRCDGDG